LSTETADDPVEKGTQMAKRKTLFHTTIEGISISDMKSDYGALQCNRNYTYHLNYEIHILGEVLLLMMIRSNDENRGLFTSH
jgi:hypothetical protein